MKQMMGSIKFTHYCLWKFYFVTYCKKETHQRTFLSPNIQTLLWLLLLTLPWQHVDNSSFDSANFTVTLHRSKSTEVQMVRLHGGPYCTGAVKLVGPICWKWAPCRNVSIMPQKGLLDMTPLHYLRSDTIWNGVYTHKCAKQSLSLN